MSLFCVFVVTLACVCADKVSTLKKEKTKLTQELAASEATSQVCVIITTEKNCTCLASYVAFSVCPTVL